MKKIVRLNESDIENMVKSTILEYINECKLNEDMTRGQVEDEIEDYVKGKDFEKRVHNIVVDSFKEFIENMWMRKSFWSTMLRKK